MLDNADVPAHGRVARDQRLARRADRAAHRAPLVFAWAPRAVAKLAVVVHRVQQSGTDKRWRRLVPRQDAGDAYQMGQKWLFVGTKVSSEDAHGQLISGAHVGQIVFGPAFTPQLVVKLNIRLRVRHGRRSSSGSWTGRAVPEGGEWRRIVVEYRPQRL